MKKQVIYFCGMLCIALLAVSCSEEEVCTVCTEATTSIESEYCETEDLVEFFEDELISSGADLGQSWSCERQ